MRLPWIVAAVLVSGCLKSYIPRFVNDQPPTYPKSSDELEYQNFLETSTQSQAVYDYFDTRAFVRAVLQTPSFVETRVRRNAYFFGLSPEATDAELKKENERLSKMTEVVVAISAPEWKYQEIQPNESIWRLVLQVGDKEYSPTQVIRLGKPTMQLRAVYSWLEPFWVTFQVQFPKVPAGLPVTLRMYSPVGQVKLTFPPS